MSTGINHYTGSILGTLLLNIFLYDMFFELNQTDFASQADDNTPYVISYNERVSMKIDNIEFENTSSEKLI